MLEWKSHKRYGEIVHELKRYPFFNSRIKEDVSQGTFTPDFWSISRPSFKTLDKAKEHIIKLMRKDFKLFEAADCFKDLEAFRHIWCRHSDWCNNTGHGYYIAHNRWERYQWISGRYLTTSGIANFYSLRFRRDQDINFVKAEAFRIVKKHVNRFMNETEDKCKNSSRLNRR